MLLFAVVSAVSVGEQSCSPTRTRTLSLSLLTTLPYVPAQSASPHIKETLVALGENARSPLVETIVVLLDTFQGDDATRALRDRIQTDAEALEKIRAVVFGTQPTYAQLFQFANEHLTGIVALMNADIRLKNLDRIDADAFYASPPLALVIAVEPPSFRPCRAVPEDRCNVTQWKWAGSSWDVEIFKTPLFNPNFDLLDKMPPAPIYMNEQGAENRAGFFLAAAGYELYNPCHNHLAEHWHCWPSATHFKRDIRNVFLSSKASRGSRKGAYVEPRRDTRGILCDKG